MKLQQLKNSFSRFAEIKKYEKEAKFLDKHITIHNNTTYGDSFQQMNQARKTLANYAKKEKVKIDIYDARHELSEDASPIIEDKLSQKLSVYVTDKKSGRKTQKFVSAKTDETHPYVENDYIVVDFPEDDLQMTRITKHEYEDNFLRHLYRNIGNMVNELHDKK